MDRSNHYEAAFEAYLQWHRLCYVAVDETRRAQLGDIRVKNLDFIVYGAAGAPLPAEGKGWRVSNGPPRRARRAWGWLATHRDGGRVETGAGVFLPRAHAP